MRTKTRVSALTAGAATDRTEIYLELTGGHVARFTFTDARLAREYFDIVRTIGVIGGSAIRYSELRRPTTTSS